MFSKIYFLTNCSNNSLPSALSYRKFSPVIFRNKSSGVQFYFNKLAIFPSYIRRNGKLWNVSLWLNNFLYFPATSYVLGLHILVCTSHTHLQFGGVLVRTMFNIKQESIQCDKAPSFLWIIRFNKLYIEIIEVSWFIIDVSWPDHLKLW
jgi:hypothetical protein